MPALQINETGSLITIASPDFEVDVDTSAGTISSYTYNGVRLLHSGNVPNFWRAPLDNDYGNGMDSRCGTWRNAGQNRRVTNINLTTISAAVARVDVDFTIPTSIQSNMTTSYTVYGSGDILVENTFSPGSSSLPEIPEVGAILTLPGGFETVTWYAAAGQMKITVTGKPGMTWACIQGLWIIFLSPISRPRSRETEQM